jgi:glycosyltransferase involved in cell wall biosynthesis
LKVALIAPPFISIPPPHYGGTELFIQELARGLKARGVDVVLYTNGESTLDVKKKWLYPRSQWPLTDDVYFSLRDMEHHAWAIADATAECDLIHANNIAGLTYSRFVELPFIYTVHHVREETLAQIYQHYPQVNYACISRYQAQAMKFPRSTVIHHGIDTSQYRVQPTKQDYLAFLGRIAPVKGLHLAIEVAKRAGMPLKIGGEIQPLFRDYWDTQIKPHLDGKFIEYLGEMDLAGKNQLLGNARAMLFPIQWHEPFGLVMVESMACGTPVLAFSGGSVDEIVLEGVSGHVCRDVDDMARSAKSAVFEPAAVRRYVDQEFSTRRMVDSYLKLYRQALAQVHSRSESRTA